MGAYWICKCDCGKEKIVYGGNLRGKNVTSCGCAQEEARKERLKSIKEKYKVKYITDKHCIVGVMHDNNTFIIDKDDYINVKKYTWNLSNNGYIQASYKGKIILLHRLIMNISDSTDRKIVVDHINHKKTDNRKENLRVCSSSNNNMNREKLKSNTSGVTGVTWNKKGLYWVAQIGLNDKTIILGCFNNFDDAVMARKRAEEKYFGKYSYENSVKAVDDYIKYLTENLKE